MAAPAVPSRWSPLAMEVALGQAKEHMLAFRYHKAVALLQQARVQCKCVKAFRQNNQVKEHSSAKDCLLQSILSAAVSRDCKAVYRAATSPCSCGEQKLSCDQEVHLDALDKLAACSEFLKKPEVAIRFAAAAIHLCPQSPVGYCRLSKLIRTSRVEDSTLVPSFSNEALALGLVRQGMSNVETYGNVKNPLYQILRVILKNLARTDPLAAFPKEIQGLICSFLETKDLIRCTQVSKHWMQSIRSDAVLWRKLLFIFTTRRSGTLRRCQGVLQTIRLAPKPKTLSTLSLAEVDLSYRQYESVFNYLRGLRHLHIDNTNSYLFAEGWGSDELRLPSELTRLTFRMNSPGSRRLFDELTKASALTLEELQVLQLHPMVQHGIYLVANPLPNLKVLRFAPHGIERNRSAQMTIHLLYLCLATPKLEQLCLDNWAVARCGNHIPGRKRVCWPNLKVLVLGWGVTIRGDMGRFIPDGIRVLDVMHVPLHDGGLAGIILPGTFDDEEPDDGPSDDALPANEAYGDELRCSDVKWPKLEHLRFCSPVSSTNIPLRNLEATLENGNLRILHVTEQLALLPALPYASQHVQVLGLDTWGNHDDHDFHTISRVELFAGWVGNFPNAHTFAINADRPGHGDMVKFLITRPGTKRVITSHLTGMERDEIVLLAKRAGVELWERVNFPVVFPWAFNDDGDGGRERDVTAQWRNPRGVVWEQNREQNPKLSNQPFFRE